MPGTRMVVQPQQSGAEGRRIKHFEVITSYMGNSETAKAKGDSVSNSRVERDWSQLRATGHIYGKLPLTT